MADCISRQAAINAVEFGITYAKAINKSTGEVKELFKEGNKALNEAVERIKDLPSAQPEERTETHACDCIERQAAIDVCDYAIDLWHGQLGEGIVIAVKKKIKALPSAQPERRWIPCSERMPKKNGFYLCATKDCITILEFIEGNPHYHEEPSFVSDVLGKCNSYVVAWMPLPEPYAERRTDDR